MADGVGQVVRAADGWIDCRPVDRTGPQVRRSEGAFLYRRPISRLVARTVVIWLIWLIWEWARSSRLSGSSMALVTNSASVVADSTAADSAAAVPRAHSGSNEHVGGRNVSLSGKGRMSLTSDNLGLFRIGHCSYQSSKSKPRGLRKICPAFTLRQDGNLGV